MELFFPWGWRFRHPLRFVWPGGGCRVAIFRSLLEGAAVMDRAEKDALLKYRETLDEVKRTEATNTRSAWTDYEARMFFVDYGTILLQLIERSVKNG